ncbi:MAG: VOC family protein [Chloroflexi bacterium]|nr:VOC family protein [Chloroflexota bacterium]
MVDDIETTLKKVAELGGKVTIPKAPLGAGYGAYFADPSGNLLGLYEDRTYAVRTYLPPRTRSAQRKSRKSRRSQRAPRSNPPF